MMNGTAEHVSRLSHRSTSPRPPTVGEEVKKFHDVSCRFPDSYKSHSWNMEDIRESPCGYGDMSDRPVTPACAENVQGPGNCIENSPNPSPPPPFKWAQSLLCLLEDIQGVSLFQHFLKQEGQDTRSLDFWFACRGVKKAVHDKDDLVKLLNVLYEKKVKRISSDIIRPETKKQIEQKLHSHCGVDDTIFDVAQHEVETYMMKTTYPNFLKSDIYIQHIESLQTEVSVDKECLVSPEAVHFLPTVDEDSELHISSNSKMPVTKDSLWNRNKIPAAPKMRTEVPTGSYLKSPYGNYSCYHSKYGSYLPTSAQDSELQSLSSDAQTDDTMSLTDSSVDYPLYSRNKQKRQQKAVKHNAALNKDRLSHSTFIPRTQRLPESMQPQSPAEFHASVVKKLNKFIEEQKMKEKISERLKFIEGNECSKHETAVASNQKISHKSNMTQVFDTTFFYGLSEDNVQDILDKHVSRVFEDSGQHTPNMSPGCISPPVPRPTNDATERFRVPPRGLCSFESSAQGLSYGAPHKVAQVSPFSVPYNVRHRRDHDTHSNDSGAVIDCISDDNLASSHRGPVSTGNANLSDYSQGRRSRDQPKRYASKKFSSVTDSGSSCVDSGISLACESVPPSHSKVTHWLETKRCVSDLDKEQHVWKNSSTSPVLSRSSSSRKAVVYNSSRSGVLDTGSTPWPLVPSQPLAQDPSMPALPPPDTTTNLIEARRRLEDESRVKLGKSKCISGGRSSHDATRMKVSSRSYDSYDDGFSHRKQSRKSCPGPMMDGNPLNVVCNELTVIGYSYGRHSVPYLSKLPGKNITLRQFKSLLSKKGNFRYFFKKASNDFGTGVVFEEVTEDYEVLPLWEGKVFCVIETMDDNST